MVRLLLLMCCIATTTSGCIIFPGDSGEFRPPYVGATPVVDAVTRLPVHDAKVVIVISREAAFVPDTVRPPDLIPSIKIDLWERTDKLSHRFREFYVWPWGALGSSGYRLNGMYAYKRGYLPVEYRAEDSGKLIELQPLNDGTSKPELIARVLAKVEERFRDRVRRELDQRLN